MPGPTRNDVLIGIFFVITGLIHLFCDTFALKTEVEGLQTMKKHRFNHFFVLWTLKQILLACLLLLWKSIDSNILGMGRFRHAEFDHNNRQQRNPTNVAPILQNNDNQNEENKNELRDEHLAANNNGVMNIEGDQPIDGGREGPADENGEDDRQPLVRRADEPKQAPVNQAHLYRRRPKRYTKLLFFPSAFFNQAHIILVLFGLRLTYPSSMIMLRGTEAFFVFLLALAFLAQQIPIFMWIGVVIVAAGFAISGLSDYIHIVPEGYEAYGIAAGDLLFTMGQITTASQTIYQEKFMRKLSIHPMKFLGSEGIYSMVFSIICLIVFNYVDLVQDTQLPNYRLEDIADAFTQMSNSPYLVLAVVGSVSTYVVYIYLGMLIIKEHGAMTRVMISMLPSAIFWAISIGVKWQNFYITQIPGFMMVLCGLLIYSHILVFPCLRDNNVAGEIGPNDFFMNNDDHDHDQNNQDDDELQGFPPAHNGDNDDVIPAVDDDAGQWNRDADQNGCAHAGLYAINNNDNGNGDDVDDVQLIRDGLAVAPGGRIVGMDEALIHA